MRLRRLQCVMRYGGRDNERDAGERHGDLAAVPSRPLTSRDSPKIRRPILQRALALHHRRLDMNKDDILLFLFFTDHVCDWVCFAGVSGIM